MFFGKLHSSDAYGTAIANSSDSLVKNEAASRDLVFKIVVQPMNGFSQEHEAKDAKELARRVRDDFHQADDAAVQSFVLGDAWSRAILVGPQARGEVRIGVVDWEFAGFGRGVTGDFVQPLAHLYLHFWQQA